MYAKAFSRLSQIVPIKPSSQNSHGTRIPSWQNSGSFIDSFKWDIFYVWQYFFQRLDKIRELAYENQDHTII
jgi:hypothetical protein